jgi:hypothetical protein
MAVIPSGARNLALVGGVNRSEIPRSARNDSLSATVSRVGRVVVRSGAKQLLTPGFLF